MTGAVMPLVSICIPTYNRASMVGEAIQSALDQKYPNLEVLVVDNASSDGIEEVVGSFHDARLKFFRNERNLGLFGNFNRCIELANGEYIHILHSDDAIEPGFTETCMNYFLGHPGLAMTFTPAKIVANGTSSVFKMSQQDIHFSAPEGFRQILLRRNFIMCPSVIVRKDVYSTIGPFSLEYPYSSDYYQWLKIARIFDIAYVAGTHVIYRQGEHSESFRFQFLSPVGYIDTLKIFIQICVDLGEDHQKYAREINTALRIFIGDCLFAGITRSDSMKAGSSGIFWGICLGAAGLIQPQSFIDSLIKTKDFLIVQIAGFYMQMKIIRGLSKKILLRKKTLY